MISARTATAVSSTVQAPMSSPQGAKMRSISSRSRRRRAAGGCGPRSCCATQRADVAGAGLSARHHGGHVELRVVGEDQHGVARTERDAVEHRVGPADLGLGRGAEAARCEERRSAGRRSSPRSRGPWPAGPARRRSRSRRRRPSAAARPGSSCRRAGRCPATRRRCRSRASRSGPRSSSPCASRAALRSSSSPPPASRSRARRRRRASRPRMRPVDQGDHRRGRVVDRRLQVGEHGLGGLRAARG